MKSLTTSLLGAAFTGAFTLLRPADWSQSTRRAFVVLPGVVVGAGCAYALSKGTKVPAENGEADETTVKLPLPVQAALAVGLGAATSAASAVCLPFDAWLEQQLVSRGTSHPRRWMAAGGALLYLGVDLMDPGPRDSSRKR